MEGLASSTQDEAESGAAVRNEDINASSMLIDAENDNFKSEKSFLEDIARKQAEIIHGFPLVSLTGVSDVAKHLPSLQFAPVSAFPYPPPKPSGSTRGSDYTSTKHSDDQRTHFHDDPLFKDYEREVRLLMGTTKHKDATVSPADWTAFKAHARGALYQAIQEGAKEASNIVWKDPPFGNPAGVKLEGPYEPSSFLTLRDADPSGPKSLAVKLIDDLRLPYPSPASHSHPSLYNPSATIYKPSREVDWDNLTRAQKTCVETSKAFLRNLIRPTNGEHEQGTTKPKSPIPLIPLPSTSSVVVTPRKPSGRFLHPESASSQPPIASTSAVRQSTRALPSSYRQDFPSPISQTSSSPDPLAGSVSRSRDPSDGARSSPRVVVEVQVRPKAQKRTSTANLHGHPAKRHVSNMDSDLLSPHTSEMDNDASDDAEVYIPSSDSIAIQAALPSRNQPRSKEVQSPSKAAAPVSTLQMEEKQIQHFSDYVDEILDAEDSRSRDFFLESTSSQNKLLLTPSCMRKISKAVRGLVKRNSGKRIFEQAVDVDQMTRLLAILQRSIEAAEDLAIVPAAAKSGKSKEKISPSKTPKKSKKTNKKGDSVSPLPGSSRRRSSRSATPTSYREDEDSEKSDNEEESEEDSQPETPSSQSRPKLKKRTSTTSASKGRKGKASKAGMDRDDEFEWDEKTLAALDDNLVTLKNAITATDTVMILLGSASLPKQLYSEDLINLGLGVLKTQLASVIYPSLDPERSPLGSGPVDQDIAILIRKILTAASSAFTSVTALLKQEDATDATLINAVYIAIAPFFSETGMNNNSKDVAGSLEMKVVRSQALAIIRTVFARYPEQRQWIIEEVLLSITKLPDLAKRKPQYMLRNGQAIQAISALLLHIVQSCTSGLRARMLFALQSRDTSATNMDEDVDIKPSAELSENTVHVAQNLVEPVLEAARQSARVIVGYVVKRSGKAPKNSTAGEAEYKALLEHLVRDLLIVADLPEWPAATLMLQMAIKAMIAVLDDGKVTADANTAKGISLEHLGTISSKVFKLAQASKLASKQADQEHSSRILPITEVLREQDRKALRRLATAEHAYIQQLLDDPTETEDIESAVDFASARWSAELLRALRILQNLEEGYKAKFEKELYTRQDTLWEMAPSGVTFQSSNDEHQAILQQTLRTLFPVHELCQSMDMLLAHVLRACEGAVIAFRQKALKGLASIVEQDPSIFLQEDVRVAVEKRLMDSSAAVRDAALEMLGRYVVYRPELAQEYLSKIEERINDSGLSVRKRVIKLLKSLYPVLGGLPQRASICRRLVGRVYDEDDSVKELAASAFEDIYLPSAPLSSRTQRGAEEVQNILAKRREAMSKGRVLMTVAAEYRDRPNPLEDVLRMIFEKYCSKKSDKSREHLDGMTALLKDIVEVLIDSLVDPEQTTDFKLVHCVKTVYILLAPEPSMLEVNKAAMLLPYLKSATNIEEQTVVEYLSKIFALILPTLPRSASTFAYRLQDSLRGLLNKPAAIGVQALPDVVSCFCSVVVHQTNDYSKLCNVFVTCYTKLQQGVEKLTDEEKPITAELRTLRTQLLRSMPVLARLVALFCQFGNFDRLRASSPDAAVFIDAISRNSIEDQVYHQMIQLYHLSTGTPLHGTALQCLGFLYRAHPMFMLEENSTAIMDKIFLSGSTEAKALLLRTICDFLVSQTQSGHVDETDGLGKDVDMTLLIGNADNFADSGVSTSIAQRYLVHILEAALTPASSQSLLRPALEAIGFTVRQGLAHPMHCLPVLVALETCTDASVASKAFALHSLLHEKHSGLINTRLSESIDTVVKYQKRVLGDRPIMGHTGEPPSALLCRWYSLMREKRQWRNDFLKAFLRGLHVEPTASEYTQENVNVARFTAENLATFEYKSLEEVFFVVRTLTVLLSVAGMQTYHQMQKQERLDMKVDDETVSSPISECVVRKSVALGFAFCLRQQLKTVYGITDQKLAKYSLGKKSPAGDKPAVPKGGERIVLSYENLPFTTQEIVSGEDCAKQCEAYIALIDSDGSIREAEGENDSDENFD